MTDIEGRLRSAMHDAIDDEETAPEELIVSVRKRHRRRLARLTGAAGVALAIVVPTVFALTGKFAGSGAGSLTNAATSGTKPARALSGLPMAPGKNFEVLSTSGHGASWYSVATHAMKTIKGLPAVVSGYQFKRVNGGWIAWPISYNSPCSISVCAGPPTAYYFIAEGSLIATRIGSGYAADGLGIGPGTRAGTVWLVTYPRITTSLSSSAFAQLVSTAGHPLGPRYRLPANYLIGYGGVGGYLLLDLDAGNQTHFELWNPRTNRVLGHYDNVIAAGPEQIVWTNGCQHCEVQVTNVSTGKTMTTPIPGAQPGNLNATMSDDGRLLAVQLPGGGLAVYNTITRSLTRIPGTALTRADFEYFGWQNGGHRLLVFAGPNSGAGADQLAYWQPGDAHLYVETVRNPSDMEQLQTGSA